MSRSRNVYTLEIRNAAVSDSGKYTIKAKNFHGQCSATASLTVLRKYTFAIFPKTSGQVRRARVRKTGLLWEFILTISFSKWKFW